MTFTAVTVASIFGPILVILGIWNLLYHDNVKKVVDSIKHTPSALYLGAIMNLIVGLTIVRIAPDWLWEWTLLVTIFGWLLIVRAIFVFFLPKVILKMIMTSDVSYKFFGLIGLVWGVLLCWIGYR